MEPSGVAVGIRSRIRSGRDGRFWSPDDFDDIGSPLQVDRVLSRLAMQDELRNIRRGLYWWGKPTPFGMSRPSTAQVVSALVGDRGVGPGGLSAANDLGLTTQVPSVEVIAVPRRPPRPLPQVRFVDRSGRPGRVTAGLHGTEVAFLEVLGDWNRVVELPPDAATRKLVDLVHSGAVRTDRIAQAARSEPAVVRDRLRQVLIASGAPDVAARVPASRSVRPRAEPIAVGL